MAGNRYCQVCGTNLPPWEKRYERVYSAFLRLQTQYQVGQISYDGYRQALDELMFTDEAGNFWMLGVQSGRWYRNQSGTWQPANPPSEGDGRAVVSRAGKMGRWFAWGSAMLGLMLSAGFLLLAFLAPGQEQLLTGEGAVMGAEVHGVESGTPAHSQDPAPFPSAVVETAASINAASTISPAVTTAPSSTFVPDPLPTEPAIPVVELLYGNALEFSDPPDYVGFANTDQSMPPPEMYIATTCQDCWRYNQWFTIAGENNYIEVVSNIPVTAMGVQFWGDINDNWVEILLDGEEIYQTSVQGEDANWPGGAFVRYLSVSNLPLDRHTLRVRDLGVGPGGGVTLYFFGLGDTIP